MLLVPCLLFSLSRPLILSYRYHLVYARLLSHTVIIFLLLLTFLFLFWFVTQSSSSSSSSPLAFKYSSFFFPFYHLYSFPFHLFSHSYSYLSSVSKHLPGVLSSSRILFTSLPIPFHSPLPSLMPFLSISIPPLLSPPPRPCLTHLSLFLPVPPILPLPYLDWIER